MTDREIEALCANYNYEKEIEGEKGLGPNPESPDDFAQRMVDNFISDHVKAYELKVVTTKAKEEYNKDPETTFASAKKTEIIK